MPLARRPRASGSAAAATRFSAHAWYASGETSSSFARLTSVSSATRLRVGSPSGRKRSSGSFHSRSRRKMICSGRVRTRNSGLSPASIAALAEHAVAEGVEGADPGLGVAVRDELVDALRHLARGLVGEGEGEDLLRPRLLRGDEVGDAAREDGGLAGARAGHDEQRARAVGHRLELGGREPVEDAVVRRQRGRGHGITIAGGGATAGPSPSARARRRRSSSGGRSLLSRASVGAPLSKNISGELATAVRPRG